MKWLKFWDRFCDVFKWAHGLAFTWFTMALVASVDADVDFLRVFGVLLYSGGATVFFYTLQEIVKLEMVKSERAEQARAWYLAFSDVIRDIRLTINR